MNNISNDNLTKYLSLYKDNYRFVKKASYEGFKLKAEIEPFAYEFTSEDLDYITATQIALYLSQLTYVLIGNILENELHPLLHKSIFLEFFKKMHEGRLFFLDLNQRMRKPIWKKNKIYAEINLDKVKKSSNTIFGFISFSINDNSCNGSLKIGMEM